jgi:hypothetical protein
MHSQFFLGAGKDLKVIEKRPRRKFFSEIYVGRDCAGI